MPQAHLPLAPLRPPSTSRGGTHWGRNPVLCSAGHRNLLAPLWPLEAPISSTVCPNPGTWVLLHYFSGRLFSQERPELLNILVS